MNSALAAAWESDDPGGRLRAVRAESRTRQSRPAADERAEVHRVAGHVARGALEVLAGSRQAQQLASLLVPAVYRSLLARAELSKRARELDPAKFAKLHQGVKAHSVHSCAVAPGVYELSVVVTERIRCRALAMRIEKQGGNWKVTALLIG
ncbi:MAG: hypothetical protein IIZ13_15010 [Renibacterium sp.]|nr:hypothetical protein [Renibacterium sp.]